MKGQAQVLPVVLDAGPAVHQRAGLSRYAEQVALHLIGHEAERIDLSLFFNAHRDHLPPRSLRNCQTRTVPQGQRRWRLGALISQILRNGSYARPILAPDRNGRTPSLFHATEHLLPHLPCPTALTVHDLIFERWPEHHTRANRLFLRLAMPIFTRAAGAIIAVSQHTKQDLVELYKIPEAKIHVIYEGVESRFRPASPETMAEVRAHYSPERPYLLMVGTLEPRKNHNAALRALARLKEWGYPHRLVIVGGEGWLFSPIRSAPARLGLENDVLFAGYVADEELPALYTGADCLLQPSLYEGFGFPVLEAMACATPVVCSKSASLPEVAGKAALLVEADDDEEIAMTVRRILDDPELAGRLGEEGIERAGEFSWSRCARETADLYLETVGRTD